MRAYSPWPIAIKLAACARVTAGESMAAVAHDVGVSDTTVRRWYRGDRRQGRDTLTRARKGGRSIYCPCGAQFRQTTVDGYLVDYCERCHRPPELIVAAVAVSLDLEVYRVHL